MPWPAWWPRLFAREGCPCGYAGRVERRFDTVHTARLVMRRWRESDREPYAAMNADPEVMRYFPARPDRAASDAAIDRMEDLFDRQGFGLSRVVTI